jgi:probable HAF family extracellular repeat protein
MLAMSGMQAAQLYSVVPLTALKVFAGLTNSGEVVGFTNTTLPFNGGIYAGVIPFPNPISANDGPFYSNPSGTIMFGTHGDLGVSISGGTVSPVTIPGASITLAGGVNDAGTLVGGYYSGIGMPEQAFSSSNGTVTTLGTLGGSSSYATAINRSGTIVGASNPTGVSTSHAFSFTNGVMTDLGALPTSGGDSVATAVNDSGVVIGDSPSVGYASGSNRPHAFISSNGTITDLGAFDSFTSETQARAINNAGVVVGFTNRGAFIYSNGTMTNLNTLVGYLNSTLSSPWAINDSGEIVVSDQYNFFYLLVPAPNQVLTFAAITPPRLTDPPFPVYAASTSGLPVSYSVVSGPATISGNTVTATGVGTVTVQATQAGNSSYAAALPVTYTFTVGRGAPVVTWPNPPGTYYGTPLSGTQLNATANMPGTFTYSPAAGSILGAGTHTLSVTFTPTDLVDYAPISATTYLKVAPATPSITWTLPGAISYGTALSSSQLDAYSDVPGTFSYSPAAGTTPAVGLQTLSVTFTPRDTTDYATTTVSTILTVNPVAGSYPYSIVDMGAFNGTAINNLGDVVGTDPVMNQGVVYSGGVLTEFGDATSTYTSSAAGINDSETIVGSTNAFSSDGNEHGFIMPVVGDLVDIGTAGGPFSTAVGINNAGTVIGTTLTSNGAGIAFLYSPGSGFAQFGSGSTQPYAINSAGTVVGTMSGSNGGTVAFQYQGGLITYLGSLTPSAGYSSSSAYAINSGGLIAGSSTTNSNRPVAISFSNGTVTNLGAFGGYGAEALGINDSGTIVGDSGVAGSTDSVAFIYSNGAMTDLNTLTPPTGRSLSRAAAINNKGQIVALG